MAEEIKKEETAKENKAEAKTEEKAAKKPRKNAEVERLKTELDALNDRLLRTAAEFDNFKKRTEREKLTVAEFSKAQVMKNLLPILDNADRVAEFEHGTEQYNKGIEMIVKQLNDLSSKLGLIELGVVGEEFNPEIHEAIMHIEDENLGENTVAAVMQ
ncbi:MAG: nucleotide exchange factor GrpE [Clostridia bacterium]|nr:nucleotide exchange factor GrpE [Clostridia bacterium]